MHSSSLLLYILIPVAMLVGAVSIVYMTHPRRGDGSSEPPSTIPRELVEKEMPPEIAFVDPVLTAGRQADQGFSVGIS